MSNIYNKCRIITPQCSALNNFLCCFKSKNDFMLEICKFGHLKMFVLWKVKLFCLAGLFLFNLCSNCGCEWKSIGDGILWNKIIVVEWPQYAPKGYRSHQLFFLVIYVEGDLIEPLYINSCCILYIFFSAWLDLSCKLCLLLLHKPKEWFVEETSGVNEASIITGVLGI